jgi:PhzF family phenazine biosynthesis protein
VSDALDLIGYYIFTTDSEHAERDATTRMFAPRYGIKEESATGMAAGPLVSYLFDVLDMKKKRFLIQQGSFMDKPSPSLIIVDLTLEKGEIIKIMAGGKGQLSSKMVVDI